MKAFVMGGSRGIGRAVAEALMAGGAEVAIGCRGEASMDGARVIRGDVADDPAALVDEAAAALDGLTAFVNCAVEPIAKPILELGITVNAVAPGPTATEAFDAMAAERLVAATPMGRLGEPEDAARLVAFLCSPEAGWVTGQLIFSDGGYLLA